ncbi:MAG: hypothetical protein KJ884_20835 [Gammaproteobacteria bacterium]|nr:hypothetical protein [Gammaproteobacteria bacterium]MBU1491766.1 hypothetical protein [Gammaproteobacteria bacterium]MBU2064495.1 hypothetical protein [Gammaproteobacteria bacterium]MBU2138126.1 hypothetical protein [Gammaproteobacteria bacterium]MBU2214941.1 hypothetical protein [Gammaproteobacteria bacterium]
MRAGRDCPLDYRLPRDAFSGEPVFACDTLYVVGGLYGNRQALAALQRRLAAEPTARVVFNGDAHWFDRDPEIFQQIEQGLSAYLALRGNVETELGRADDSGAGCGCAYPMTVDEAVVERSNAIQLELNRTVQGLPGMAERLATRPSTALVKVGGQHVAISHGDEQSLAGWSCSRESLSEPARQQQLDNWFAAHNVQVLATSHTCSAVALGLEHGALINNGAAGLPNFAGGRYGLLSRIATMPHPAALYRCQRDGLFIEALPLNYDHDAFLADFQRQWPDDSPAALSYRARALGQLSDRPEHALLAGFSLCQSLCALEALTDE